MHTLACATWQIERRDWSTYGNRREGWSDSRFTATGPEVLAAPCSTSLCRQGEPCRFGPNTTRAMEYRLSPHDARVIKAAKRRAHKEVA